MSADRAGCCAAYIEQVLTDALTCRRCDIITDGSWCPLCGKTPHWQGPILQPVVHGIRSDHQP